MNGATSLDQNSNWLKICNKLSKTLIRKLTGQMMHKRNKRQEHIAEALRSKAEEKWQKPENTNEIIIPKLYEKHSNQSAKIR
jgi:metal-responsive CopG/Arc/MetJ family transcriptional regulator